MTIEVTLDVILLNYIHRSKHPEGDRSRRYRATMPDGSMTYHPTVYGAILAILSVCGVDPSQIATDVESRILEALENR